ncbi:MAG: MTH938/NDUFAF3 family protein [Sphingomonadaceae bacterium]
MPRLTAAPARIGGRTRDGGWMVEGRLYRPALLIGAGVIGSLPGLMLDDLATLALPALPDAELLLLGTGAALARPPAGFVAAMAARGIRVEPMDSGAAARTFNVLTAEARLVAALIL